MGEKNKRRLFPKKKKKKENKKGHINQITYNQRILYPIYIPPYVITFSLHDYVECYTI